MIKEIFDWQPQLKFTQAPRYKQYYFVVVCEKHVKIEKRIKKLTN